MRHELYNNRTNIFEKSAAQKEHRSPHLRERSLEVVPLQKLQVGTILDSNRTWHRTVIRASGLSHSGQGIFTLLIHKVICGFCQPLGDKVQGICKKQGCEHRWDAQEGCFSELLRGRSSRRCGRAQYGLWNQVELSSNHSTAHSWLSDLRPVLIFLNFAFLR